MAIGTVKDVSNLKIEVPTKRLLLCLLNRFFFAVKSGRMVVVAHNGASSGPTLHSPHDAAFRELSVQTGEGEFRPCGTTNTVQGESASCMG